MKMTIKRNLWQRICKHRHVTDLKDTWNLGIHRLDTNSRIMGLPIWGDHKVISEKLYCNKCKFVFRRTRYYLVNPERCSVLR